VDLDSLAIGARRRSGWSAIDLGFTLTRQWWRPLFLSWLIPAAAVCICLHLVLWNYPEWAILLTWWLKPLFDRFPLWIASRRLFGERPGVAACLRQWRAICATDALPWLLWRRLNPMRSLVMPVTLLEGLRGRRREARLGVLQRESSGCALWLTVIGVHLETLLPAAVIFTGVLLLPNEVDIDAWALLSGDVGGLTYLFNALTLLIMALVAPFYVCAGFTLYINRRIELEGWDIEVSFRSLAARLRALGGVTASGLLAVALLLPAPVRAAQEVAADAQAQYARQQIETVLEGDSFHQTTTVTRWRYKYAAEETQSAPIPEWFIGLVEWFENIWPDWQLAADTDLSALLAWLLRALVVAVLVALLLLLALRYRRTLLDWAGLEKPAPARTAAPQRLFGMAVTPQSLPVDVPAQVMAQWRGGDQRGAVSLLYRATLTQLLHRCGIPFTPDLTETECVALVQACKRPELGDCLDQVTRGWMRLAYGHIDPGEAWLQEQCARWQGLFADE